MDEIYQEILRLRESGEIAALATVIRTSGSTPGKVSSKMLVYQDGRTLGTVGGGAFEAEVTTVSLNVIRTGQSRLFEHILENDTLNRKDEGCKSSSICGGRMEVFVEPITTKPALYIMGAGHIGEALARIGKIVGFRIVVVDDREKYANRERFPYADEIHVVDFGKVSAEIKPNQSSYVVIVTRGHEHDKEVLSQFVNSNAKYVGMIGSRKKVEETFKSLISEGVGIDRLKRVYAPIGLNLGAQTPGEIAVSIVAQIIAGDKARDGKTLTYERMEI